MSAVRLQREVEHFTDKLEREKQLSLLLDEEIKTAKKTLESKVKTMRETHRMRGDNERDRERARELESVLNLARKHTSALSNSNQRLRELIDTLRQSTRASLSISTNLSQELLDVNSSVGVAQTATTRTQRTQAHIQSQINSVVSNFEEVRNRRTESVFTGRKERKRLRSRQSMKDAPQDDLLLGRHVLSFLQEKWLRKIDKQREELRKYAAFAESLRLGFQKIMERELFKDYKQVATVLTRAFQNQQDFHKQLITLREQADQVKSALKVTQDRYLALSINKHAENFEITSKSMKRKAKISAVVLKSEAARNQLAEITREIRSLEGPLKLLFSLIPLQSEGDTTINSVKGQLSLVESTIVALLEPKRTRTAFPSVSHVFITERVPSAPSEGPPPNFNALLDLPKDDADRPLKFEEFRKRAQRLAGKLPA